MKYHTLLIGTSKTLDSNEYYGGKNINRFWGTLKSINSTFSGQPQTSKLNNDRVLVTDISSALGGQEKKDKQIKAVSLQKGFEDIEDLLKSEKNIERIGFIGKQAAQWFFIRFIDKIDLKKVPKSCFKVDLFEYGKQSWTINFNNKTIYCYLLRNTSRQWKEEANEWREFWQETF